MLGLQGPRESFADTLRADMARRWETDGATATYGITPLWLSEGGVGKGGREVTGTVGAHVTIRSKTESSNFKLTWRTPGTAGNEWHVRVRTGSIPDVLRRNAQKQVRITWPTENTMQQLYDYVRTDTTITAMFEVSGLLGDTDAAATDMVKYETIVFEGGQDNTVDREIELTTDDMRKLNKQYEVLVKVYDADDYSHESARSFLQIVRNVVIDVWGEEQHASDRQHISDVRDWIDGYVWHTNYADSYIWNKSHDDMPSGIQGYAADHIEWSRIAADKDNGITGYYTGELQVLAQYHKSDE